MIMYFKMPIAPDELKQLLIGEKTFLPPELKSLYV